MKKIAVTLSVAFMCSASAVMAQEYIFPVLPVGCSVQQQPCEPCVQKPCEKTCEKTCEKQPVFNTCEEIQKWKNEYFQKRCVLYSQLGLSQEQRLKAKAVDEKYFDEVVPLKVCCKSERAKYKEMKCNKCKWSEVHEQRSKYKDIKAEIKEKNKEHVECFEKILTSCQKDSYKKNKYRKNDLKSKC